MSAGANYWQALACMWEAEAPELGMAETVVLTAYLHVWNARRRPRALDAEQWTMVMALIQRKMSRARMYEAVKVLEGAGWLSLSRRGRTVERVGLGVTFESRMWTGSPECGLPSPECGLPYYVQESEEEYKDSLKEGGERGGTGLDPTVERRLCALFQRPNLSRAEQEMAARLSARDWEMILAFHAAPASDGDERRFRRRSLGALLANLWDELDRATAWLDGPTGKEFRPRRNESGEWRRRLESLPEDILPGDWMERWEMVFGSPARPWSTATARERQTFLACLEMGLQAHQVEHNAPLARRCAERWLTMEGAR